MLAPEQHIRTRHYADVDGVTHILVQPATLEALAFDAALDVEFPPDGPGFATTHLGNIRLAAWIGNPS